VKDGSGNPFAGPSANEEPDGALAGGAKDCSGQPDGGKALNG